MAVLNALAATLPLPQAKASSPSAVLAVPDAPGGDGAVSQISPACAWPAMPAATNARARMERGMRRCAAGSRTVMVWLLGEVDRTCRRPFQRPRIVSTRTRRFHEDSVPLPSLLPNP